MKPSFEKVAPNIGSSFTYMWLDNVKPCDNPFWHFHPEYEIVYIENGSGKRHIGNHISTFNNGDLVFIGPNIPHLSFDTKEKKLEIVVQLPEDFLGEVFLQMPELESIKRLLQRSKKGISFHGTQREQIGNQLKSLHQTKGLNRLLGLLKVLQLMADATEVELLHTDGIALVTDSEDYERIQQVYTYVTLNYQEQIKVEDVAEVINISVPGFAKFFKRTTGKTFINFLNEYRIARACQLLAEKDMTIAVIGFEVGFNNLSHFNKQFKQIIGVSPKEYRSQFGGLLIE